MIFVLKFLDSVNLVVAASLQFMNNFVRNVLNVVFYRLDNYIQDFTVDNSYIVGNDLQSLTVSCR